MSTFMADGWSGLDNPHFCFLDQGRFHMKLILRITLTPVSSTWQALALSHNAGEGIKRHLPVHHLQVD